MYNITKGWRSMLLPKDIARFWAAVDRSGECWVWTRSRKASGYGRFMLRGRQWIASRISWIITNGPIPDDKHVLHHCDNPPCVRPSHLFIGTDADNMADRDAKGRRIAPRGSGSGMAKLDEAKVLAIKQRYAAGEANTVELAQEYGVTSALISGILRGRLWRHVGGIVRSGNTRSHRMKTKTLSQNDVRAIRAARAAGASLKALASQYGCSESAISMIARRKAWQHVE